MMTTSDRIGMMPGIPMPGASLGLGMPSWPFSSPLPCPLHTNADGAAVGRFAGALYGRLSAHRADGHPVWDGDGHTAASLSRELRAAVEAGDPLEVAVLAMRLHQRGEQVLPVDPGAVFAASNMFWDASDPECAGDSPEEILAEAAHFDVGKIHSAQSGPTRFVFVTPGEGRFGTVAHHYSTRAEAEAAAEAMRAELGGDDA